MLNILNKFKKQQDILVLDIGSYQMKLVVGNYHDSRISIKKLLTLPTPLESYQDGEIKQLLELKETIKLALRENNIQVGSVLLTIEHKDIIKRELSIPIVKPEELKEMISYQVQEYFPIALEKYVVQHKILNEFTEDGIAKYNLLVAACPKAIVDAYYQLVDFLGLEACGLDLHSNSVSKLFSERSFIPEEDLLNRTFAVVDLGHMNMNVIILERGIFKFNRLISIDLEEKAENHMLLMGNNFSYELNAYNEMTNDLVAASLEISEEAGSGRSDSIDRFKMEKWLAEMDRVFKYYTSRSTGNIIDKIFIYGGYSNMDGVIPSMEERFSTPICILNNLANVHIQEENPQLLSNFINAIGALIRR